MIKVLRLDSTTFKETKRYAVSINPLDMTNTIRRVVMVSLTIDKPTNDRAFGIATVEGTLNDEERTDIRGWAEHLVKGPVKVTMSV